MRSGLILLGLWSGAASAGPVEGQTPHQRCEGGVSAEDCRTEGLRYAEVDPHAAVRYFRLGCELDDGESCARLATAYWTGHGTLPDQIGALTTFVKACELGVGRACREAGDISTVGVEGTSPDGATGGLWYQLGCDQGDGESCAAAGVWLERGDVMEADPVAARASFERGCELGAGRACTLLAVRVARGGEGSRRDPGAAATLWMQACTLGDAEGCRSSARAWKTGRGVTGESLSEAMRWLEKGCADLSDGGSCRELAQLAFRSLAGDAASPRRAAPRCAR